VELLAPDCLRTDIAEEPKRRSELVVAAERYIAEEPKRQLELVVVVERTVVPEQQSVRKKFGKTGQTLELRSEVGKSAQMLVVVDTQELE
jgi:hypothetical protein